MHVNKPGYQSTAPHADQTQATTSQAKNTVFSQPHLMGQIFGALPQNDLKNVRLTNSKFQAPAERNMNLRLRNRQANEEYAQSPNFGRGRQAKTVTGLSVDQSENLVGQMKQAEKKLPVNTDRKPGETDFEYEARLTHRGFAPESIAETVRASSTRETQGNTFNLGAEGALDLAMQRARAAHVPNPLQHAVRDFDDIAAMFAAARRARHEDQ